MKLTIEIYGKTCTIEDANDLNFNELMDHFVTIARFMTYSETVINSGISDYYEEHCNNE